MNLRQKVLRAGVWTVASYSVELSTRLLTNLVMTRLLFPDAFGVVAAATALIVGLQLLSDSASGRLSFKALTERIAAFFARVGRFNVRAASCCG